MMMIEKKKEKILLSMTSSALISNLPNLSVTSTRFSFLTVSGTGTGNWGATSNKWIKDWVSEWVNERESE